MFSIDYNPGDVAICYTYCNGSEDNLTECDIYLCDDKSFFCIDIGITGIKCSE